MPSTVYDIRMMLWDQSYQRWISEELFSFGWFFNIIFLALLYTVWILVVDKKRLREILLFGALMAVVGGFVDVVGVSIGLWEYRTRLLPFSPALFPFDYTVIPIFFMLALQYTSTWRNYFIGSALATAAFSFIVLPVYVAVGITQHHNFNYVISFILTYTTGIVVKFVYDWITKVELQTAPDKRHNIFLKARPAQKPLLERRKEK